ncbi:MAG: NAD(+) synthase [Clostridiales bacterium]|nr:NAD(+) synthase [Clostridiales bacterium]
MSTPSLRVAAVSPKVYLGDCEKNLLEILSHMDALSAQDVHVALFPLLSLTGATLGDLFLFPAIHHRALLALQRLLPYTKNKIMVLGLPYQDQGAIYNVAVVCSNGKILGLVPKSFAHQESPPLPSFSFSVPPPEEKTVSLFGQTVPFGSALVFREKNFTFSITFGLCETGQENRSSFESLPHIIFSLDACGEFLGAQKQRENALAGLSQKGTVVYASAGYGESTTDQVFSGYCAVYSYGQCVQEGNRFERKGTFAIGDIPLVKKDAAPKEKAPSPLSPPFPFFPSSLPPFPSPFPFLAGKKDAPAQALEVFSMQSTALQTRLEKSGISHLVIGVSGGLDSTLALLAAAYTFEKMHLPAKNIFALSLPGFGTSKRTKNNGRQLSRLLQCTYLEIDITKAVLQHFKDINHPPDLHDVTFENSQARERTQILMDYANKVNGLVLGTGNLSEIALGFSTYNADHMSMYSINCGIPKTLVKALVSISGQLFFTEEIHSICKDIVATPISPELLPTTGNKEEPTQITEEILGSYALHDFFLYHFMAYGANVAQLEGLAEKAFEGRFSSLTIKKTLQVFFRRFFTQQFKRSCMPDGPQIVFFSLSPRGGWSMPSDIGNATFFS